MNHRHLLIAAGLSIILLGGMAQGWMTYRWSANTAVAEATVLLDGIPSQIGDWTSSDYALTDNEIEVGRIDGYVKREYVNALTGARVHLLLMCGAAGPISLHSPTVCFSGQGYRVVGHQSHASIREKTSGDQRHDFHQADFGNSAVDDPTLIRLYWAWSTVGKWAAPVNPRVDYAGEPALYKLYVSEQWVPTGTTTDTGVARLFMDEMLPIIRVALQPKNSQEEK
jgi:hypothetical protein